METSPASSTAPPRDDAERTAPPPPAEPGTAGARRFSGGLVVKVAILAAILLYPLWYDQIPTLDSVLTDSFDLTTMTTVLNYMLLALGLNIVVGFAGLLDLGYVAFWAVGAFFVASLASGFHVGDAGTFSFHLLSPARSTLPGVHISFFLILALVAIPAGLIGIIIGTPTLRLRGDYLAIVTLGFGEIIPIIARNGDRLQVNGFALTDGPNNVGPVDAPGFGSAISSATGGFLPERISGTDAPPQYYVLAAVMLLVVVLISVNLRDSRLGRAWVAIREDELAAGAMGVPLVKTKLLAYVVGALIGGWGGVFYGAFVRSVTPEAFAFQFSILVLAMIILGGIGNITGVLLGAAILSWVNIKGLAQANDAVRTNGLQSIFVLGIVLLVGALLMLAYRLYDDRRRSAAAPGGEPGGWGWRDGWTTRNAVTAALLAAFGLLCVVASAFGATADKLATVDLVNYNYGIFGLILVVLMLLRPQGLIPSSRRKAELTEDASDSLVPAGTN